MRYLKVVGCPWPEWPAAGRPAGLALDLPGFLFPGARLLSGTDRATVAVDHKYRISYATPTFATFNKYTPQRLMTISGLYSTSGYDGRPDVVGARHILLAAIKPFRSGDNCEAPGKIFGDFYLSE
jgi:hypothetical protein